MVGAVSHGCVHSFQNHRNYTPARQRDVGDCLYRGVGRPWWDGTQNEGELIKFESSNGRWYNHIPYNPCPKITDRPHKKFELHHRNAFIIDLIPKITAGFVQYIVKSLDSDCSLVICIAFSSSKCHVD